MKRTLLTAVLTLALTACSAEEQPPMTFGDGAFLIADSFCQRDIECGGRPEQALATCIDSQLFQLCIDNPGLWDCDHLATEEEAELFEQCADDLLVRECIVGQYTEACVEVLSFTTEGEEE